MNDIKATVAKNIAQLRQANGMTQLELAEKLNYSDKAVSKWERAESLPDITVLVSIAGLFGVTLDYLVQEEHPAEDKTRRFSKVNFGFITGIGIIVVWLIALTAFVVVTLVSKTITFQWFFFIYAIPATMVVWLVLNSVWFNRRRNYLIISLLMWSVLVSIHVSLMQQDMNLWLIYLLGIPGQLIILLWSKIRNGAPACSVFCRKRRAQ